MSQKDEEKKKKKKQSILEKEIFSIMEKSMKTALDAAVDDLLKDWDKEIKIKLYRIYNLSYDIILILISFVVHCVFDV